MKQTRIYLLTITYDDQKDIKGRSYKRNNRFGAKMDFDPNEASSATSITDLLEGSPDGIDWFADIDIKELDTDD